MHNLLPLLPFVNVEPTLRRQHKSNYRFPDEWRNMQQIMHETVRRCEGPAGSAVIFTEA